MTSELYSNRANINCLKEISKKESFYSSFLRKIKNSLSKIGLYVFFIVYTTGGAQIFQILEHPAEVLRQDMAKADLKRNRLKFLNNLTNIFISKKSMYDYQKEISSFLSTYEAAIEEALQSSVSPLSLNETNYQWQYIECVFFASTIVTTIGYGNMAPVTTYGRVFCIMYGFVGIPLTISVITDLGTMFANIVLGFINKTKEICCRSQLLKNWSKKLGNNESKNFVAVGVVFALALYLAIGGAIFTLWEDWTFFEAFYFCFITMTTIGLGDLVPARTEFILVCTVYILIGLALTSTCIELIRRQYAESWQQMKELSGRLGELSGPLADQLKRMGNHDLNIDMKLSKELKDLKACLLLKRLETISKADPKLKNKKINFEELLKLASIEEDLRYVEDGLTSIFSCGELKDVQKEKVNPRKRYTIIIYESSV